MIEPDGAGCRLAIRLEYELPGEIVGSLFGMLTGNRIEREFRRTYDNLRRVAEAGPTATGLSDRAVARFGTRAAPAAPSDARPSASMTRRSTLELPVPGLVVLIGAAGSGKSTLAARLFAADELLSSDALRAAISGDAADQRATRPAFAILHREALRRLDGRAARRR